MRWNVQENDPPIAMTGAVVRVDGEEVPRVTAFDTEGGWVTAHCLDGHTGHPGQAHLNPHDPTESTVCSIRIEGRVTVDWPDGGPPHWLEPMLRERGWEPPE